jgi:hypothetical protein
MLAAEQTFAGWAGFNRALIGRVEATDSGCRATLDMVSTEIPVYGEQHQSACNGHFESTCYPRLLLFNREGDCLRPSCDRPTCTAPKTGQKYCCRRSRGRRNWARMGSFTPILPSSSQRCRRRWISGDVKDATLPQPPIARKAANSSNSKGSGDVFLVLMAFAVPCGTVMGGDRGPPWNYDLQVSLILWGGAFKPEFYATPCQPIDLTATLAARLGLTQPSGTQRTPLTPS